jgi:hypothetical protein
MPFYRRDDFHSLKLGRGLPTERSFREKFDGSLRAPPSGGGGPAMTEETKIRPNAHSISTMEDFGRFNPGETSDSDTEITDESLEEAYAEENAGA